MRRYLIPLGIVLLIAIPASVVAADQVELTKRQTDEGVERLVLDDETGEVTRFLDGTPVSTRAATDREFDAAARVSEQNAKRQAVDDLATALDDISRAPSINPEIARLEQAVIDLAAAIGVE